MKKEQEQRKYLSYQKTKLPTSKTVAPGPHCQQRNHSPEKCCSGVNPAIRPKRFKWDKLAENAKEAPEQGNSTHSGPISILEYPSKEKSHDSNGHITHQWDNTVYMTHRQKCTTLIKLWTPEVHQLSGSNKWKKPIFKDKLLCIWSIKHFQHINTTTQKTLTPNSGHTQKSLLTTYTSLTLKMDVTPRGIKTYLIKENWITKRLTMNLMIKVKVTIYYQIHMDQTHFDTHYLTCGP